MVVSAFRHFYPKAQERFPALAELPHMNPYKALLLSGAICKSTCKTNIENVLKARFVDLIWQLLYWKVRHWLLVFV